VQAGGDEYRVLCDPPYAVGRVLRPNRDPSPRPIVFYRLMSGRVPNVNTEVRSSAVTTVGVIVVPRTLKMLLNVESPVMQR